MVESVGSMSSDDGRNKEFTRVGLMIYSYRQSTQGILRHSWMPQRKRALGPACYQAGMAPALGHQNDRYAASSRVLGL